MGNASGYSLELSRGEMQILWWALNYTVDELRKDEKKTGSHEQAELDRELARKCILLIRRINEMRNRI